MRGNRYFCIGFFVIHFAFFVSCNNKPDSAGPKYGTSPSGQPMRTYTIAVYPMLNPTKLFETNQPLIEYLNKNLKNVQLRLEASRDYSSFEGKYKNKIPDFLIANPWQTLQAEKYGYNVITTLGDAADFKGLFIIKKDNTFYSPSELKGRGISYPAKTSMAACIMPQYFLFKHGINIKRDIRNIYVGSQESSIMNVYLGKADIGATWPIHWRDFQKEHPHEASSLKVLWETEPMINTSLMVKNSIPSELQEKIRALLIALNNNEEGKRILEKMEITRFIKTDNKDYEFVRKYISNFERKVRKVEE